MKRVLFLCSANSARSIMAEALLRHHAGDQFEVHSAGTEPEHLDPSALAAIQAFGLPEHDLYAKHVKDFQDQHFDYVISLCEKAHQDCRHWPHTGVTMAWDFPDPKASTDPKAFARTLQEISDRIRLFIMVNEKSASSEIKPLQAVDFYKLLADETRLFSLLLIMHEQELCVCELMEALDQLQPKISRHLSQLRKAGLLLDRRQGQWVFYRLHPLLHDWMRDVLYQTGQHSAHLLKQPLTRLQAMPNRPSKGGTACSS